MKSVASAHRARMGKAPANRTVRVATSVPSADPRNAHSSNSSVRRVPSKNWLRSSKASRESAPKARAREKVAAAGAAADANARLSVRTMSVSSNRAAINPRTHLLPPKWPGRPASVNVLRPRHLHRKSRQPFSNR